MRFSQEELLFQLALTKLADERAAWLDHACADDPALRQRLQAWLARETEDLGVGALEANAAVVRLEPSTKELTPTLLDETPLTEGPGTVIGRYKLLEQIGEGGFGVVYVAEQREPVKRKVALKIIKLGMDTRQVVARFEAERQALSMMDHPNIAKVFDGGMTERPHLTSTPHPPFGHPLPSDGRGKESKGSGQPLRSDEREPGVEGSDHPLPPGEGARRAGEGLSTHYGRPYFVMELVRGIRITDYCDQERLTTLERLKLFITVCQAIQHAHQKGIIHRDIKPSNILVTLQDGKPIPKVIDFGIAKATQQKLTDMTLHTHVQQFIGTPAYMSPEQAEMSGLDIDTRSDIYSLGVLLYELLVGKTPFDSKELLAAGLDEIRRTIREKEPARPSTRVSTMAKEELTTTTQRRSAEAPKLISILRGDLDWIVMKCLEKDRTRRYETANGLGMDIERHLKNEPVVARPPSTAYRFQKLVRRNKLAFAAVAAVAAVLVAGIAGTTWQAVRATRFGKQAVLNEQKAQQAEARQSEARAMAQQNLYDSLVREASATRLARRIGYRDEVFTLLKRAKALDVPNKDLADLRREAAACLGDFVGLNPITLTDFPTDEEIRRGRLDGSGHLAAFGLSQGTILVRELPSGHEVARFNGEEATRSLWFSVTGDRLVSVHMPEGWWGAPPDSGQLASSVVHIWSRRADGNWSEAEKLKLPGAYECLGSEKGVYLAVADLKAHSLQLLDLDTKALIQRFVLPPEMDWAPRTALSPDGRWFVVESRQPNELCITYLDLWDLTTGQLTQHLNTGLAEFNGLTFSSDGKFLAAGAESGAVVYEATGLRELVRFNLSGISDISFLPGGTVIGVSLGQQRRLRLWDLARHEDVANLKQPEDMPFIDFARDGGFLLTRGSHQARVYHLHGLTEKVTLSGHVSAVSGAAFSPDGSQLASVGADRTLKVWDTATGRVLWTGSPLPGQGQFVSYSPDGRFLVTTEYDSGLIWIWDAYTHRRVRELGLKEDHRTMSARLSPDGKYLVSASENWEVGSAVRVWAIEPLSNPTSESSGSATLVKSFPGPAFCGDLIFAPDGQHFVFGDARSYPELLYVWDVGETSTPRLLCGAAMRGVQVSSLTSDGSAVVFWCTNRNVVTLDLTAEKTVHSFPTSNGKHTREWTASADLSLSPDDTKLALSSPSNLGVDLWDPKSGQLLYSLPEQNGTVYWLAWSPDSQRLAVCRADGDISIWKLPEIQRALTGLGLAP